MKKIFLLLLIAVSLGASAQVGNYFQGAQNYRQNYRSNFTEFTLIDLGYLDSVLATIGGTPAGNNRNVQFNNAGSFGGNDSLIWSGSEFRINIADSGGYELQVGGDIFATNTITSRNSIFGVSVNSRFNNINYSTLNLVGVDGGQYAGALILRDRSNTYNGTIHADTLTANRTYKIPNKSGTIALKGELTKSIVLESPTASENISFGGWYTPVAITITEVKAIVEGSSPSVTYNVAFGTDITSLTNVFTAGQTVTSVTTGTAGSGFNDQTVPANSWFKLQTSAMSGTVTTLAVQIKYTED